MSRRGGKTPATTNIVECHDGPPSALRYMARAFLPSPGLLGDGTFPSLVLRWRGVRIEPRHLAAFRRATGPSDGGGVPFLYPHVFGFRLQMALLTHRAFPLPLWTALQVRNRLVRHRLFGPADALELETRTGAHRFVEKGLEVDLLSRLLRGEECVWESAVTYFYRGRFGSDGAVSPQARSPDLAGAAVVDRFRMPERGGCRFGSLTGDYNGIHISSWYARRFGFRAALLHPQRVAGLCMARLPGPVAEAQMLELWIKGPVFYGANVVLSASTRDRGLEFGLALDGDPRAALVGSWRSAGEGR